MEWISIEDRLPSHNYKVLIYSPVWGFDIDSYSPNEGKWLGWTAIYPPTYWAELKRPQQRSE